MTSDLARHVWRSSVRSLVWKRELAANIFIGVVLSLLAVNLLSVGLFLHSIMKEVAPELDPVDVINGALIYYFGIDLVLRMLLQKTPDLQMRPYLLLPVARRDIATFLLLRSALTLFNLFPLFILVPVVFTVVAPVHTGLETAAWIGGLICWILSANYLAVFLDQMRLIRPATVLLIVAAIVASALAGYFQLVSFSLISATVFGLPLGTPALALLPVLVLGMLLVLNSFVITRRLYLETLESSRSGGRVGADRIGFMERWGDVGTFLALELKLLFRNKRTKSSLGVALFIFLLCPAFYFTMSREFNVYPLPDARPESEVYMPKSSQFESMVTFKVIPDSQPENTWIYVTGDHTTLGRWRPSFVPLVKNEDGSWSRSVPLPQGINLRYIFTLGSWQSEAGKEDGETPDVQTATILNDTTLIAAGPVWKTPRRFLMVDIMLVYMGILIVGGLMLVYGQFMFAWESNYFDLLLSRPISVQSYLNAKRILLLAGAIIGFLVSLVALAVSSDIIFINLLLLLYCLGTNTYVLLMWSTFARKRIDLTASIFGTQGKGASQFMTILPTFVVPILLFLPFALLGDSTAGFIALGAAGLLCLLLSRPLMALSVRAFHHQKFKMSAGFRQP